MSLGVVIVYFLLFCNPAMGEPSLMDQLNALDMEQKRLMDVEKAKVEKERAAK